MLLEAVGADPAAAVAQRVRCVEHIAGRRARILEGAGGFRPDSHGDHDSRLIDELAVIGRIGHGVLDLLVGGDDELPRLTVDAGGRKTAAVEDGLKIFRLHRIARVFANRAACGHCGNSIHEKIPLYLFCSLLIVYSAKSPYSLVSS